MAQRQGLYLTMVVAAVMSLACGGLDVEPSSDPLTAQCQQALSCGCPNNPGETVSACVEKWEELMGWGVQVSTISCFSQLDCQSMCGLETRSGQRCAMLLEQDTLAARAQIDQRNHDINMEIIRGMGGSRTTTEVYDENGVKIGEY